MGQGDGGSRRSRCKLFVLITILVVLVGAAIGICLWQFLPEDKKQIFTGGGNDDKSGGDSDGNSTDPGENDPNGGPVISYVFNQCSEGATDCCNGLETICDLRVDEILFASLHNAMATSQDEFFLAPNHEFQLESALNAGYRGINLDVAVCDGELKLIHGSCGLGSRDINQVFTNINSFLTNNPTEVVLINLQIDNDAGAEDVDLMEFYGILEKIPGFVDRMYVHDDATPGWPTLRSLTETDQRILLFHYNGPICFENPDCPPGLHDWFLYAAETQFSFSSVQEVSDYEKACLVTRGGENPDFFAVNLFVTLPLKEAAKQLNALESVQAHIAACQDLNPDAGTVNLVFVDFWSQGDLPEAVQLHNDVLGQARRRKQRRLGTN